MVFEEFKKDFQFSDDDLTDEEKTEELMWHLKAHIISLAKVKSKSKGEALLKQEASEIRKGFASKISDVESKYNQVQSVKNLQKSHEAIFSQLASAKITDSVEIDVSLKLIMRFHLK